MVTVDEITSTQTAHRATRCPGGWSVTWLGDRTVTEVQARDAIELAELVENSDLRISQLALATYGRINQLAYDLGIWVFEAIELIQAHPRPVTRPPKENHMGQKGPFDGDPQFEKLRQIREGDDTNEGYDGWLDQDLNKVDKP